MSEEFDKYIDLFFNWENPILYSLLIIGVILLVPYIFYFHIFIPNKKEHLKEKIESDLLLSMQATEKFKSLSFQIQEKIEMEKQRLGRELHDCIAQNLIVLQMKIHKSETPEELSKVIDSTLKDLKEIIFDLKPRALEDLGLTAAVVNLCEHINTNSNINGMVNISGSVKTLSKETELYLYRIIQEILNNIIKHSEAKEYNIQFIYNENALKIMTMDDGKGMNIKTINNGYGLFNVEERIKYLGGIMKINSAEDEGTVITMEIPYDKQC